MAALTVTDLIDRCHAVLFDDGTRWPKDELLGWYNDAIRAVITLRPDAGTVLRTLIHVDSGEDISGQPDVLKQLVSGTRQTLPADAAHFMRVERNAGQSVESTRSITELDRHTLDRILPSWTTESGMLAQHYVFEPADPLAFHVYPGADLESRYDVRYSHVPADVLFSEIADWESDATPVPVSATYGNALTDYILGRAYSKSTDGQDLNRAAMHRDQFLSAMGQKASADANVAQGGG